MTITVDTTDRRDGKALALFTRCSEWQQGRTKDGRSFFAIPGSERGLLHMTDTRDCYSLAGQLQEHGSLVRRPFRTPRHTLSLAGLVGGGVDWADRLYARYDLAPGRVHASPTCP